MGSSVQHHYSHSTPYAEIGVGQIVFQYGAEWVGVTASTTTPSRRGWSAIVQAIVNAPKA